jgi:hypothetical protein
MPQIHLRAEVGDYAPLVLLPGDPGRATMIAGLFDGGLEKARLVNQHRSLFGYTGTWHGVPVSVPTSGIGTPSFSIVMEELLMLGVTRFIRTGTCGGRAGLGPATWWPRGGPVRGHAHLPAWRSLRRRRFPARALIDLRAPGRPRRASSSRSMSSTTPCTTAKMRGAASWR